MSKNDARCRVPPRRGGRPAAGGSRAPPIGGDRFWVQARGAKSRRTAASAGIATRSQAWERSCVVRIERIAQSLPEQVEAPDGEQDGAARGGDQPRSGEQVVLALEQHSPPGGCGRRDTGAEVRKGAV